MTDLYTFQEIMEFEQVFSLIDRDEDGVVTFQELFDSLNLLERKLTLADIELILTEIVNCPNQQFSFGEFLHIICNRRERQDHKGEIRQIFDIFDTNKDGFISAKELQSAMTSLGLQLTLQEAEDMVCQVDLDEDGLISYQEFVRMIIQ